MRDRSPPSEPLYRFAPPSTARPAVSGRRWAVSAAHHLAAAAAAQILASGGNAIDAGVAAGLAINVVQPDEATLGGVAPIMVYDARAGALHTVSGLGRWPRRVEPERLRRAAGGRMPVGVLRAVTPAAMDAWLTALDRWGTLSLAEVAAPAIALAGSGFVVDPFLAANLAAASPMLEQWPASAATFLPQGRAPAAGDILVQPDLAATLELLVDAERRCPGDRRARLAAARDVFYRGPVAERMAAFVAEEGGFLDAEDLRSFAVRVEPPVALAYRGHTAYACGPWSQGPVLLQALAILSGYDLEALAPQDPAYLHLLIEALKAAFADRHAYYGDPEFVSVPLDAILSDGHAARWRSRIDPQRAVASMPAPEPVPGVLPFRAVIPGVPGAPRPDTSYVCVADATGNVFSATPSDGIQYMPLVPGLGFPISGRGDQSWLDPAHPSCVAPGKRPRLTPCPGMVFRDGRPWLAYGTPGGDVQPQAMVQVLLGQVLWGMSPQEAVEAPRLATFSFPNSFDPHAMEAGLVRAEARLPDATLDALLALGHRVERWPAWIAASGAVCAIRMEGDGRGMQAAADPRRLANAIAW